MSSKIRHSGDSKYFLTLALFNLEESDFVTGLRSKHSYMPKTAEMHTDLFLGFFLISFVFS